jgi:hypothetical protein
VIDTLLSSYSWVAFWDSEHGADASNWVDRVQSISLPVGGTISLSAMSPTGIAGYALPGDGDLELDPSGMTGPTSGFRFVFVAKQAVTVDTPILYFAGPDIGSFATLVNYPGLYGPDPGGLDAGGAGFPNESAYQHGADLRDGSLHVIEHFCDGTHAGHDLLADGVSVRGAVANGLSADPVSWSASWSQLYLGGWGADYMTGEIYFAALAADDMTDAAGWTAIRAALDAYYITG